jgi:hypothetical protein
VSGSLAHIVNDDGTFTTENVENLRDCNMALEECHQIIAELLETVVKNAKGGGVAPMGIDWTDKGAVLELICNRLGYPVPGDAAVVVPRIQPELHGAESVYVVERKFSSIDAPSLILVNGVRYIKEEGPTDGDRG